MIKFNLFLFFFSSRRRHTSWPRDWSSDVCSSDLPSSSTRTTRPRSATWGAHCRGSAGRRRPSASWRAPGRGAGRRACPRARPPGEYRRELPAPPGCRPPAPRRGESARRPAPVIEFDAVGKTYRSLLGRPVRAVEDFSLEVRAGEVMGIAGPNGAGKSTLISLLLGYLVPTTGAVRIAGMSPRAYIERYGVGYLW